MSSALLFSNSRGQALVENLLSLPALVSGITLVLGGLHSLFAFYLVDYWSYQAVLCLVEEKQKMDCEQQWQSRVGLLPFVSVKIIEFRRHTWDAKLDVQFNTIIIRNKRIQNTLKNQTTSSTFGVFK